VLRSPSLLYHHLLTSLLLSPTRLSWENPSSPRDESHFKVAHSRNHAVPSKVPASVTSSSSLPCVSECYIRRTLFRLHRHFVSLNLFCRSHSPNLQVPSGLHVACFRGNVSSLLPSSPGSDSPGSSMRHARQQFSTVESLRISI